MLLGVISRKPSHGEAIRSYMPKSSNTAIVIYCEKRKRKPEMTSNLGHSNGLRPHHYAHASPQPLQHDRESIEILLAAARAIECDLGESLPEMAQPPSASERPEQRPLSSHSSLKLVCSTTLSNLCINNPDNLTTMIDQMDDWLEEIDEMQDDIANQKLEYLKLSPFLIPWDGVNLNQVTMIGKDEDTYQHFDNNSTHTSDSDTLDFSHENTDTETDDIDSTPTSDSDTVDLNHENAGTEPDLTPFIYTKTNHHTLVCISQLHSSSNKSRLRRLRHIKKEVKLIKYVLLRVHDPKSTAGSDT
ncbi:hypothetical protein BJX99DRAFT_255810 [Aspergillus californicus]